MVAKISYKDDTLSIEADESSEVRNITVRGNRVYIEREVPWYVVLGRASFYLGCFLFCLAWWWVVLALVCKTFAD